MNYEKVMEALSECEQLVFKETCKTPLDDPRRPQLSHCLNMIRCAREMGPERKEKLMRWLGFIQGVLWTWGVPLDDLEAMNRSKDGMV